MYLKKLGLFSLAVTVLLLAGCNNQEDSSATIEEKLNYTINGIEPGSGTMELANNALQDYENLKGARIGFVVPTYMDIDSIEDLAAKE